MATYKLMQDIEAEDHILGPLSLRQFIFGLIAAFLYYLSVLWVLKKIPFLLVLTLPPAFFFTFFAFPFGKDQPTEVWALAHLRFFFKPRNRIWDQDGKKELVTVTVPKKVEHVLTNGLDETEVKSRLSALAATIDSRGWATKNINLNTYTTPNPGMVAAVQSSDRLINLSSMPQAVPTYDVAASDDILDEKSNPIAQQFDHMINQSAQAYRQQLVNQLNAPTPPSQSSLPSDSQAQSQNYWFMNNQANPVQAQSGLPLPTPTQPTPEEEALVANRLRQLGDNNQGYFGNMRTIQPLGSDNPAQFTPADTELPPVGTSDHTNSLPPTDPAILSLANNNDLNVATLAREAHKVRHDDLPSDEVEISLH